MFGIFEDYAFPDRGIVLEPFLRDARTRAKQIFMKLMRTRSPATLLLFCFSWSLLGAHCGAPTEFTKEREREKSPCALECERGTRAGEQEQKAICMRACEAKNDIESEKK